MLKFAGIHEPCCGCKDRALVFIGHHSLEGQLVTSLANKHYQERQPPTIVRAGPSLVGLNIGSCSGKTNSRIEIGECCAAIDRQSGVYCIFFDRSCVVYIVAWCRRVLGYAIMLLCQG